MGATHGHPPTVLVVTADPALAGSVRALARSAGCRAAILQTWAEFEDALGHLRADLVVADSRALPDGPSPTPDALAGTPLVLIGEGDNAPPKDAAASLPVPGDDALGAAIRGVLGVPG